MLKTDKTPPNAAFLLAIENRTKVYPSYGSKTD